MVWGPPPLPLTFQHIHLVIWISLLFMIHICHRKYIVSIYHAAFSGRNLNWDLDMLISIFGKMQINTCKRTNLSVSVSPTLNTFVLYVLKS